MIKANGRKDAKIKIAREGYVLISLKLELFKKKKINYRDLSLYCGKLASLLQAGIDLSLIMDILHEESNNSLLEFASKEIKRSINMGESLSTAFEQVDMFPDILINMVRVGEETGELDTIFSKLSDYFYEQHKIKNNLKKAMIYPSILIGFTSIIWLFLIIYIVPKFKDIFIESDIVLPFITKIIFKISDFLLMYPIYILLVFLIIIVSIFILKNSRLKGYVDEFKTLYLSNNSIYKKTETLNIITPLSMMYKSGISIIDIFENIKDSSENLFIRDKVGEMTRKLERGESLSKVLLDSKLFPKMITTSVKVGEESGNLDNILEKLTEFYENDLISKIEKVILLIEPIMVLIIGVIIGGIAIGLVVPIIDLMNTYI